MMSVAWLMAAAAAAWCLYVQCAYWARRRQSRLLAKQGEWHTIFTQLTDEFANLYTQGFHAGLFRTQTMPELLSRLLHATKEFTTNAAHRIDCTDVLIREALRNAPGTERHKLACARLNQIHGMYSSRITNTGMVWVLSTLVVQPVQLINKFGARKLTAEEVQAIVWVVNQYGEGLGVTGMPGTYQEYCKLQAAIEEQHQVFDPINKELVDATFEPLNKSMPPIMATFVRKLIMCLIDEKTLQAAGVDQDPSYQVSRVHRVLITALLTLLFRVIPRLLIPPTTRHRDRLSPGPLPPPGQRLFCRFHEFKPAPLADGYQVESLGTAKCPALNREQLLAQWPRGKYAPEGASKKHQ